MRKNNEKKDSVECYSPSLISFNVAVENILSAANSIDEVEVLKLENCLSRVLAEDVISTINVPGYDNSAMDGYVVRAADCAKKINLAVTQRIPAGTVGELLSSGEAARIFTGAPIPDNADAVIMQEQCVENNGMLSFDGDITKGQNIRKAGEDIQSGSVILSQGYVVRPQELGYLASIGIDEIKVFKKLRVAVFFTGDELVLPGHALGEGEIYNSNQFTLCGLLEKLNCDVINLGIVPDSLDATVDVIKNACSQSDLIITSGGVSVGEEDYVRVALEQLGQLDLWRIAIKPGKPVAFGNVENTLFMGLPGNPVSVFVTFLLFARPLIMTMQGVDNIQFVSRKVKAGFDWKGGKRQEFLRARLTNSDEGITANIYPHQGSGVLSSACWADGLIEIKIDEDIKQGDMVSYIAFNDLV